MTGTLGIALTGWLGTHFLGFSTQDWVVSVLASNVAGFFSLLWTLWSERVSWIKKKYLGRSLHTWAMLSSIYLAILLLLAPPMRDWKPVVLLFVPSVMSTGFMLMLFGPVQDFLVRRAQRRESSRPAERRAKAASH